MGKTEPSQINKVVMQGTVMAGMMCAKLIDTGKEIVETGGGGVQYGEIRISALMFQDYILQTSINDRISVKTAAANELFQNANRMKFNMQKSQVMMVHKRKLPKLPDIRINSQEMGSCSQYKYLGDNLNCKTNLDVNIEKREKQAHLDTMELIAISKGMNIPEKDIQVKLKPKIYYNSETWTNIRKSDINYIDKITLRCLKRLLKLPESTPGYGLYAETGIMPAEQQITKKKLIFLHRILSGPPTKLIKQVYDEQQKLDMPRCWSEEINIIKKKYNLEKYSDEEIGHLSKYC